jgi:hypothetical protein
LSLILAPDERFRKILHMLIDIFCSVKESRIKVDFKNPGEISG